ncbi:MAG: antibiotic biosynthesis monooxygenase [Bacillaceae bacterium]|nr:antibiotic biosynthesis monooxygenase [Bacillaceae bacterium]
MYIVHSIVVVPDDKIQEVISLYQNRSRSVDREEGFMSFKLLQNEVKKGELTVQMEWESEEHYFKWIRSDNFKQIHELEKKYPDYELASIKPIVQRFKVVAI